MQVMDGCTEPQCVGNLGALFMSPAQAWTQALQAQWQQHPLSLLLAMALGVIAVVMLVYGLRQSVRNQCLSGQGPGRVKV